MQGAFAAALAGRTNAPAARNRARCTITVPFCASIGQNGVPPDTHGADCTTGSLWPIACHGSPCAFTAFVASATVCRLPAGHGTHSSAWSAFTTAAITGRSGRLSRYDVHHVAAFIDAAVTNLKGSAAFRCNADHADAAPAAAVIIASLIDGTPIRCCAHRIATAVAAVACAGRAQRPLSQGAARTHAVATDVTSAATVIAAVPFRFVAKRAIVITPSLLKLCALPLHHLWMLCRVNLEHDTIPRL